MSAVRHKPCLGKIFPKHVGIGEQAGKVFSVRIDPPAGMMRARTESEIDIQQWDDCQRCPEFESCYPLSMATLALQTAVAAHH
ncbi:hypothetical protein K227x_58230 [Rubripirellula lacrimiformis]|uniref:Uncharacterized protein n=1 Tax=Rubripirellula lacrimiformis TaxID=1930273 RepID=A0A517NJT9_9BACT|nr:hypothetical protein K227x_58230 [Rubripirellula lacrimiformis]